MPVIVIGRKGSFGAINWSRDPVFAIDTTYFIDPNLTSANMRWLYYVLVNARLDAFTQDTGVPGLNREKAYETHIPVTDLETQRIIANFLDRETTRLDHLIEKKQRLIELLEEKRTALITHAVTKGLDPNVTMKDSGIPWLGEIPEHWNLLPIRRISQYWNSNVDKKSVDGEIPVHLCNYTDVYYSSYIEGTEGFMEATATLEEIRKFRLRSGYVLITKDSETADDIGVPAYINKNLDAVCGYHLTVIKPNRQKIDGEFLYWVIESPALRAGFEVNARGITRFGLTLDGIGSLAIPLPPLNEQEEIKHKLRDYDLRVKSVSNNINKQLEKLSEYRQALITAAVTGQIDVTEKMSKENKVKT